MNGEIIDSLYNVFGDLDSSTLLQDLWKTENYLY